MSLAAGARLGPYQVVSALGAGGMGEVYRARDSRLGRDVAVKVLPGSWAQDEDRLRRFEHEARAVGSLNHPNLLTVFDVGTCDGSPYLVSELLEGTTLRSALESEVLPLRKALDYAVQIARGLAAAHEKGIVHRDLKPENLFITRDGRAKILDFGLAKLSRPSEARAEEIDAPTATSPTSPGTVMGTLGYMSPEQVQGLSADQRSDIFSFGAVIFEMFWGRRAFKGATAVETMNAILKEDPSEVSDVDRPVPLALERIARRCLEKKPQERFHSAHDLALALEAVSGSSASGIRAEVAARPAGRPSRTILVLAASALLATAFLVGERWDALRGPTRGERIAPSFTKLTFERGTVWSARFAPDGRTVVYSARWGAGPFEIFSTRLDAIESKPLGLAGADVLGVSSQGEMAVALGWRATGPFAAIGTLARVPLGGGAPREVLEGVRAADWAPDGKSLAVARAGKVEFPIGKVLYEARAPSLYSLRVSPSGDRVAFLEVEGERTSVAVLDLSGKRTVLSSGWFRARGLAWSGKGDEVWFTAVKAGVWRELQAVDLAGRERLVARLPGALTLHDIAPDGRVLLAQEDLRREVFGLAPGESQERDLTWRDYSHALGLSADGRKLLFAEGGEAERNLYLRGTDGSAAMRLGEGIFGSTLSPDARWLLAVTSYEPLELRLIPTGAGDPRSISVPGLERLGGLSWATDGRRFYVEARSVGRPHRVFSVDLAGGPPRPVTPEGVRAWGGMSWAISPDGALLLGRDDQGKARLYPVDGGEPRDLPGTIEAEYPIRWSADGRWIYCGTEGLPGRLTRFDLSTGRQEPWKELMPADPRGVLSVDPAFVSSDGRSYVYALIRTLSTLYVVEGLR